MNATLQDLRDAYRKLEGEDRDLAASLGKGHTRYGSWTEKQQALVDRLVQRARNGGRSRDQIGDLAPIHRLFDRAAQHLKRPTIVLGSPQLIGKIRLRRTGEKSRTPGAIDVTVREPGAAAPGYLGRIGTDGTFRGSPELDGTGYRTTLVDMLRSFAEDPAGEARLQGQRYGACCFCAKELTDARSVSVGYGPICAARFGLPWGSTVEAPEGALV